MHVVSGVFSLLKGRIHHPDSILLAFSAGFGFGCFLLLVVEEMTGEVPSHGTAAARDGMCHNPCGRGFSHFACKAMFQVGTSGLLKKG